MPVALAKDGRLPEAKTGVVPARLAAPPGLSAHAQNLWLAAAHYRRLADGLACLDEAGASQ